MSERLKVYEVHQHAWRVDKVRGYWLFSIGCLMNYDTLSGYPEPSDEDLYILHINGHNIEVILTRKSVECVELFRRR